MSALTRNTLEALTINTKLQGGLFAVGKVIGQGGFGITYHGGDTHLRRYVAIKEFFPLGCVRQGSSVQPSSASESSAYTSAKAKFLEEARVLAQFCHPSIVQVYTFFEENNTAYMVMEFLKGKTLTQLVQERGALSEQEAIGHINTVGAALKEVHRANLLHRDIKPENIVVCDDGRVVLIDFGLTKKIEQTVGLGTRFLSVTTRFGSDGYAPKEQHIKHAHEGTFTDVYALGATLYYLLTGEVPVSAPERCMGVELPTLRHLQPQVSQAVNDAVCWAMEIEAPDRPQRVSDFLNRLQAKVKSPSSIPFISVSTTVPAHASRVADPDDVIFVHDSISLVRAIEQAVPNATIRLQPGDYHLSKSLVIRKSLNLIGDTENQGGSNLVTRTWKSRVIIGKIWLPSPGSTVGNIVQLNGDKKWRIEGIAFECGVPTHGYGGIMAVNGGTFYVRNCYFKGYAHIIALSIIGSAGGAVEDCAFTNNHIGIRVDNFAHTIVEGNHFQGNDMGIVYEGRTGGTVRSNECVQNNIGIYINASAQPTLEHNRCSLNKTIDIFDGRR